MIIFERNNLNLTKRNRSYVAKGFNLLQPERMFFSQETYMEVGP
jgi:hypothetical protein